MQFFSSNLSVYKLCPVSCLFLDYCGFVVFTLRLLWEPLSEWAASCKNSSWDLYHFHTKNIKPSFDMSKTNLLEKAVNDKYLWHRCRNTMHTDYIGILTFLKRPVFAWSCSNTKLPLLSCQDITALYSALFVTQQCCLGPLFRQHSKERFYSTKSRPPLRNN